MQSCSLSLIEARVLSAIGDDLQSSFRELATATRLTVGELRNALARLVSKHLALVTEDQETITLTREGDMARRQIVRHRPVAIVHEGTAQEKLCALEDSELDNAIDQEIAKLRG